MLVLAMPDLWPGPRPVMDRGPACILYLPGLSQVFNHSGITMLLA